MQYAGILVRWIECGIFRADAEQRRIDHSRYAICGRNFDARQCKSGRGQYAYDCSNKAIPLTFFNVLDANGLSHFGMSNSAPYVNTFVQGNGAGSVFLGAGVKANVADTTGTITTAGGIALQTTSQTLPASITNDTAGGILFTNNAGSSMQLGNGGTLFLNSPQGIR